MEHIAAVLLIIGCSDDLAQCREVPAPVALYETAEQCETEMPASLRGYTLEFPQLFAQCLTVDPSLEEEDVVLSWGIRNDGMLVASVGVSDVMVATNSDAKADAFMRQE